MDTRLDTDYSDPAATATGWDETTKVLAEAQLFWLSTVRPDGRPHVTPLVAVWTEGAVWFCTGANEQKFTNLQANPNVVVTTGCNGWEGGLDVVVEGRAVPVTDDAVLERVAAAFTTKWDGRWRFRAEGGVFRHPGGTGEAMVFVVTPAKVWAHAKGDPFGATAHRFPRT